VLGVLEPGLRLVHIKVSLPMVSNRDFICVEHSGTTNCKAYTMAFCSVEDPSFPPPKRSTVRGSILMAGWHIRDSAREGCEARCEVSWMTVCDPKANLPSMLQGTFATSGASVLNKIKSLVEADAGKAAGRDRRRSLA